MKGIVEQVKPMPAGRSNFAVTLAAIAAVFGCLEAAALGQAPRPEITGDLDPDVTATRPSGSHKILTPRPALSAIPPAPVGFAVMPFENRSPHRTLDWLRTAVPFILAEKVESLVQWRPAYGPLIVPPVPATADPVAIAALARQRDATWVFTGWVMRPNWKLQLSVSLWKVSDSGAALVATYNRTTDFAGVHWMIGAALSKLLGAAGVKLSQKDQKRAAVPVTYDQYALTLFGRGLAAFGGIERPQNPIKARRDLLRAVLVDPKLACAQRVLGEFNLSAGKPKLARGRFDRALELRPDYYAALAASARLATERGKLARAQDLYRAMIAARPWDITAYYQLGHALWRDGELAAARAQLYLVVAHDPDYIEARRVLVLIFSARGQIVDLVSELEHVVRLAPDSIQTRLDLAAAYAAVGRKKDAVSAYEVVLAREPKNRHALKFLGDLHKRSGDLKTAAAAYERMIDAVPDDPRPYFILGAIYVELGDNRSAKNVYRRALRFYYQLHRVYNNLGVLFYGEGNYTRAIFYLRRAVTRQPYSARLRYNYALALSASRDPEWALAHVDAGLRFEPEHAGLHYLRGVCKLRLGDRQAARLSFERTLELDPGHRDAAHNLARL